jgi:hypothetical protein
LERLAICGKKNELQQGINEAVRDWNEGAFAEFRFLLKKWHEMDKAVRQRFPNTTALYDL